MQKEWMPETGSNKRLATRLFGISGWVAVSLLIKHEQGFLIPMVGEQEKTPHMTKGEFSEMLQSGIRNAAMEGPGVVRCHGDDLAGADCLIARNETGRVFVALRFGLHLDECDVSRLLENLPQE